MRNQLRTWVLLLSILLASPWASAQKTVRFVKAGGSGDGSSWTNASGELQKMIDASSVGDEVWVAAGLYHPTELIKSSKKRSLTFKLKDGVSLYGGFSGVEVSKDDRARAEVEAPMHFVFKNQTILSADIDAEEDVWVRKIAEGSTARYMWEISGNRGNANHLLYLDKKATKPITIDGFVLTGAYADVYQAKSAGAALYASGAIRLVNSIIRRNATYTRVEGDLAFHGGAVFIGQGKEAQIRNCLFEDNQAYLPTLSASGGSVYMEGGIVEDCIFRGSVGVDEGGAITIHGGTVRNSHFYDCYGAKGGTISAIDSRIEACLIAHSRGLVGGGIYSEGSVIHHSQIINCYADDPAFGDTGGGRGGGILGKVNTTIIGSIIANCTAGSRGGGVELIAGGKLYHSTIVQSNARLVNKPITNLDLGEGCVQRNNLVADDLDLSNFVAPSRSTGFQKDVDGRTEALRANWALAPKSSLIGQGELVPEVNEEQDLLGNNRIRNGVIDPGAIAFGSGSSSDPNIRFTLEEENQTITLTIGGASGSQFSIDFGDGSLKEYSGAQKITEQVTGREVKIYGKDILIFIANDQGITKLDLSGAKELMRLQVMNNKLEALDVSQSPNLYMLYCDRNQIKTPLNLSAQRRMNVISCHSNQIPGQLNLKHIQGLISLFCHGNKLTELILPDNGQGLTEIVCDDNELTSLKVLHLPDLTELSVADNKLTSIDLSQNTKLTKLYAVSNELRSIDLRHNKALKTLTLTDNELSSIDLSANMLLEDLYLGDNDLAQIDLSANTKLTWLIVSGNKLRSLDVSQQPSLKQIKASDNELEKIDLSHNPDLSILWLGNNRLEELDLKAQKRLIWFVCDSNRLQSLDLKHSPAISWLECEGNRLTQLDLSAQTNLQKLFAGHNKLIGINLEHCQGVQGIRLEDNQIPADKLAKLLADLPDVSAVQVNDNNRGWAKTIDISLNPSSHLVDISAATAKGWGVTNTPGKTLSIDEIGTALSEFYYDASTRRLQIGLGIREVAIYDALGGCVGRFVVDAGSLDLTTLSSGCYIAVGYSVARPQVHRFCR